METKKARLNQRRRRVLRRKNYLKSHRQFHNITRDMIINRGDSWDWNDMVRNPNITPELIFAMVNSSWDWGRVAQTAGWDSFFNNRVNARWNWHNIAQIDYPSPLSKM